jgi:Cu+-exporting ATPase
VIVTLVLVGQYLELRARRRTRDALRGLAELAPSRVSRITANGDERIALDQVQVGDRLRVRAGDRVPVDGEVADGSAAIDESMLSGESVPRSVQAGDRVTGGTLNRSGSVEIRATAIGGATVLARIMALVAAAQKSKAPIQKLADKAAEKFVPAVFLVAVISFVCWLIWGPPPAIAHAVLSAVAVLIIACPCALGLATPVSIAIALGRGARSGLLIRDAASLQRLAEVDRILVDKTGTLTLGQPRLVEALPLTHRGVGSDDLLSLGAALERGSDHPFADAVCRAADERSLAALRVDQFESKIGRGVRGVVRGRLVALGSRSFMRELDVDIEALDATAIDHESRGRNVLFVALDGALAGCLVVEDPIRPDAFEALAELRKAGCRITMLSGDEARVARAVARELEITSIRAGASPEEKQRYLRSMQAQGSVVAMVGDGVNDAAALATADVGIAIGGGSEIALDAASITLLGGDLRGLVRARRLAEETMRNVRQNLWFAFLYNGIGIPIAAGLLVPIIGLRLNPMIAAAAMSLSSLSVLLNALRLRGRAPKTEFTV